MVSPIEQIKEHINNKNNFLLSGGAGSGKTYTLGQVLEYIYSKNINDSVACITYTNVSVNEIKERFAYDTKLRVSTIHDFLWDNIKQFQKNLKTTLYELLTEPNPLIKYNSETELTKDFFENKQIQYREYKKIDEGIISHDEVIILANKLFAKYPLLSNLIKDKFQYILIDEYQDTDKKVIEIFLDYLQNNSSKTNVIGLFGDSMQSIYDDKGVGNINSYIEKGIVKEVLKQDNYRCSKAVIKLINKIRKDSISQEPAKKDKNGNILNNEGCITFLYSTGYDIDIKLLKKHDTFKNWNFDDSVKTKELYLTKKLIADQCGFKELLDKYKYVDALIGDNKDKLIKHLCLIKNILDLYNKKNYRELIKAISFKVINPKDKSVLKKAMEELDKDSKNKSIDDILNNADELNLIRKDDTIFEYMIENKEKYDSIKELPFAQIIALDNYEQEKTPFSTQHGVKGAEFDNVLVILDNGKWNKYNFKGLFENSCSESVLERTRKIFYVCCSRAKDNLVVFCKNPTTLMLKTAENWFGKNNVISVD